MNKLEKKLLSLFDRAFQANVDAHNEYEKASGYGLLSHSDLYSMRNTKYLDFYYQKDKYLQKAIELYNIIKYKNIRCKTVIGVSRDKTILYIQRHHQQCSFHRGNGQRWENIPFFHGSWKKRINLDNFRFIK